MFYTHILSKIMHSPNYIYTPNNSRSGPVSGDNSNKQIFILHIFRGNKQIDYRRVRQLSNPLVCRQGRKSAYYPPVTIFPCSPRHVDQEMFQLQAHPKQASQSSWDSNAIPEKWNASSAYSLEPSHWFKLSRHISSLEDKHLLKMASIYRLVN